MNQTPVYITYIIHSHILCFFKTTFAAQPTTSTSTSTTQPSYVYETVTQIYTPPPITTNVVATTTLPASTLTPQMIISTTQTLTPTIITTVISSTIIDVTSYVSITSTNQASTYTPPPVSLGPSVISSTAPATTVTASRTPIVTSPLLTVVPSGYTIVVTTTGSGETVTIVQPIQVKVPPQVTGGASALQPTILFLMSCIVMLSFMLT
ncbi:hypothetical protein BC937DRAFT_91193 [Endogone sp. FLAS-F59071]|nr:hypothetical protein BC937DRAFT_91193 [Endogone sp. FLAS-F59071]|eukprot:RUS16439.1 hypothetical protein BC937DRAFT_91193 [Endogone sp. FLAS-F59071]